MSNSTRTERTKEREQYLRMLIMTDLLECHIDVFEAIELIGTNALIEDLTVFIEHSNEAMVKWPDLAWSYRMEIEWMGDLLNIVKSEPFTRKPKWIKWPS